MIHYDVTMNHPLEIQLREVEAIGFARPVPNAFRVLHGDEEVVPWTDGAEAEILFSLQRPRFTKPPIHDDAVQLHPIHGHATSGEPGPLTVEVRGFYTYTLFVWERQ